MKLEILHTLSSDLNREGGGCAGSSCPTIYKTDEGTIVIQGYKVTKSKRKGFEVPTSEDLVELPLEFLRDFIAKNKL